MRKHSITSLFSGCGGLDYGFKLLGFKTLFANDNDLDSCKSFEKLIKHKPVCDDVENIINKIPKTSIIIGGPPCQAFSLVGKRLENDKRAKYVHTFYKIVNKIKPKVFVMENVPGLVSAKFNNKKLIYYLIERYKKKKYFVLMHKFKAIDYGVPQKRERIFIIGSKKKFSEKKIPTIEDMNNFLNLNFKKLPVTAYEALDDLDSPVLNKEDFCNYKKNPNNSFLKFVRNNLKNKFKLHYYTTMSRKDEEYIKYIPPGGNYWDIPDKIAGTRILKFKKTGGRTTTYGRLHPQRPSATVNTYFNRPGVGTNYHYHEKRLITVREALRLQSFPDDFNPFFSNQRSLCKQIGNAVPPLLSLAIALMVKSLS